MSASICWLICSELQCDEPCKLQPDRLDHCDQTIGPGNLGIWGKINHHTLNYLLPYAFSAACVSCLRLLKLLRPTANLPPILCRPTRSVLLSRRLASGALRVRTLRVLRVLSQRHRPPLHCWLWFLDDLRNCCRRLGRQAVSALGQKLAGVTAVT